VILSEVENQEKHWNINNPVTLHIEAFMPRLVISHSINSWKSQAIWCSKYLQELTDQLYSEGHKCRLASNNLAFCFLLISTFCLCFNSQFQKSSLFSKKLNKLAYLNFEIKLRQKVEIGKKQKAYHKLAKQTLNRA
jgi:hypothetical protein